jgi:GTP-binding protein
MFPTIDPDSGKPIAGGRIRFLGSFPDRVPVCGLPEIAFAGRSNVGKSSAINRLLECGKAARVSATPGRTQAINLFAVERRLVFADLPGYGFARVPAEVAARWKGLVEGYLAEREPLKLVVVLLDPRRDAQQLDAELIWGLRQARIPILALATKLDKVKRSKRAAALKALRGAYGLKGDEVIGFSSHEGLGVREAWAVFEAAVAEPAAGPGGGDGA